MKRLFALFLVGAWAGCSPLLATKSSPGPSSSALPAGIVATVGSLAVPEEVVVSVAKTQQIPPRQAADAEVRDALLCRGGPAARLRRRFRSPGSPAGQVGSRQARDSAAASRRRSNHRRRGRGGHRAALRPARSPRSVSRDPCGGSGHRKRPPRTTERRPRCSPNESPSALAAARDADDFKTRAESITDRQGFELRIESLAPVAADGRVVDVDHPSSGERNVLPFARAAARLTEPGQRVALSRPSSAFMS